VPDIAGPEPAADLALLLEAAEIGGAIAMRHFQAAPLHWEKGGGAGPVSQADLEIDRALAAHLGAARPSYGWLSEETEDGPARLAAGRVFILDPIDGTRAFLAGETGFGIALAVAEDGRITAGVMHLPARAETYAAALGQGATLNGQPIRCTPRTGLPGARVLASKAGLAPERWPGGVPPVNRFFRTALAWRLCLVAAGSFDATLTLMPAWEWDIAAGALIAAEAGAMVTDATGGPLRFNAPHPRAPSLIAAPPALHAAFVARLSG